MEIREINIDEIKPYKNNPREISNEAVEKVVKSIKVFGYNQPIVVDNDNVIVVGHTRWKALKKLGYQYLGNEGNFEKFTKDGKNYKIDIYDEKHQMQLVQ